MEKSGYRSRLSFSKSRMVATGSRLRRRRRRGDHAVHHIPTAPYTALLRRLTRAGTARKEPFNLCGSSSAGRARASQARGRGFDPRLPLFLVLIVVRFSDPILLTLEGTRVLTRSAGLGSALNKERGHAEDTVWAGFDFGVRFVVRHGRGEGTWH